jgi:hypothetical protein
MVMVMEAKDCLWNAIGIPFTMVLEKNKGAGHNLPVFFGYFRGIGKTYGGIVGWNRFHGMAAVIILDTSEAS